MLPIDRVLAGLKNVEKVGKGWKACCPAHDDKNPSLGIREAPDGEVQVKCFARCSKDEILNALGLNHSDLLPNSKALKFQRQDAMTGNPKSERQKMSFNNATQAIKWAEKKWGKCTAKYPYRDQSGKLVGIVLRWEESNAKTFKQVGRNGPTWEFRGIGHPAPLYRLPEIVEEPLIFIVEGEKDADAGAALGIHTTTSAQGSKSAAKTDWSPLAGKKCVIIPDNDEAGENYVEQILAYICKLNPPPECKVLRLPGVPVKGDLSDWIKKQKGNSNEQIRDELMDLVEFASPVEIPELINDFDSYTPFPCEELPEPVRQFVQRSSEAIGCSPEFVALPLISALAAAIGNTRRLRLKKSWTVPAIIWSIVVGRSGSSKSPALRQILNIVSQYERSLHNDYQEKRDAYLEQLQEFEQAKKEYSKNQELGEDPPEAPKEPVPERFYVNDTTVEAVATLMNANPRGLFLAMDELAGWFSSFTRYSSGSGHSDAAQWLSMYNAELLSVDRKSQSRLLIKNASVSISGTIQPSILKRVLTRDKLDSGMAARFLMANPPARVKKWSNSDIDEELTNEITSLFDRLFSLKEVDEFGELIVKQLRLSRQAKEEFKFFYEAHNQEQSTVSGDLEAAYSKLEEIPGRLALILHLVRWSAKDKSLKSESVVDLESMKSAIHLTSWFKKETTRIYSQLSESEAEAENRKLAEWIKKRGKPMTASEIQRGHRKLKTSGEATEALQALVDLGYGVWRDPPNGKRGRQFVHRSLSTVDASTKRASARERANKKCRRRRVDDGD
ncbi:DUF3987 domain-containing protein [Bremerella sp.]|uniref:DUF3987 domain-containing protein n=1 Tax=Bremerella sp. TaxID=2795602 RepID=UPI0039196493